MEPTKDDGIYQQSLLLGADVERGFTVSLECRVEVGIRSTSIFKNFEPIGVLYVKSSVSHFLWAFDQGPDTARVLHFLTDS